MKATQRVIYCVLAVALMGMVASDAEARLFGHRRAARSSGCSSCHSAPSHSSGCGDCNTGGSYSSGCNTCNTGCNSYAPSSGCAGCEVPVGSPSYAPDAAAPEVAPPPPAAPDAGPPSEPPPAAAAAPRKIRSTVWVRSR